MLKKKKTTGISGEGNKIQCNREPFSGGKQGVCVCAAAFYTVQLKEVVSLQEYSTLAGRKGRVARKTTIIQKGCVYSKIVSGDSREGKGARNRKEQS